MAIIIQSICTLIGILISGYVSISIARSENAKSIAVIQNEVKNIKEDIGRLEKKQDKHNNLMERLFKLEQKVEDMKMPSAEG